ncbi:hypothetical protein BGX38DRAFT_1271940 [Terfezia claveryi]|nr:hypothetical protein BGX38DRAFT_1271940 [Terfezia claveryi]
MSTIANCPNVSNHSSGPSPGTIAHQARRPALIPYSADLSAYISASSSSHASFHISPFGTILGATFSPPLSISIGKAPLFVLPPSLPDGRCPNNLKPAWRRRGGTGDFSPFGWVSEEEDLDEGSEVVDKGGRKRAKTTSNSGRKARFRRSLSLGPVDINIGKVDIDVMDVDDEDEERKEVEGDVFSWVNSSSPIDDFPSKPLPNLASLTQTNLSHSSGKSHLELNRRPRKLNLNGETDSPRTWSVPTSPTSGTFGADLELQRRRLEEAGLGIESVVGFQGGGVEEVERKA